MTQKITKAEVIKDIKEWAKGHSKNSGSVKVSLDNTKPQRTKAEIIEDIKLFNAKNKL